MRDVRPGPAARDRAPAPEERSLIQFLGSFPRADVVLDPPLPEVAFLGRSNVGKSSLLNALVGQRIAKISGTPGKTRALNVFLVGAGSRPLRAPCSLYLLDLPGYGYARAGKAQRASFRRLVHHALRRPRLSGVVWLLDIRHAPSAEDRAMQELLIESEQRVLAALTKADKLPQGQRLERERLLRADLDLPEDQVVVTSAKTGEGIEDLRAAVAGLVEGAAA